MQQNEKNDSKAVAEEHNINREAIPPNKDNTELNGSSPSKNSSSINFNIEGIDKIFKLLIEGLLKLVEIILRYFTEIFTKLLEHPKIFLLLITIYIISNFSIEKIEALNELYKSLAALF